MNINILFQRLTTEGHIGSMSPLILPEQDCFGLHRAKIRKRFGIIVFYVFILVHCATVCT